MNWTLKLKNIFFGFHSDIACHGQWVAKFYSGFCTGGCNIER